MQNGNSSTMIFSVAHLVSYVGRFMTLLPGDVITTGTPPGVGMARNPRVFLKPGDELRLTGFRPRRAAPDGGGGSLVQLRGPPASGRGAGAPSQQGEALAVTVPVRSHHAWKWCTGPLPSPISSSSAVKMAAVT